MKIADLLLELKKPEKPKYDVEHYGNYIVTMSKSPVKIPVITGDKDMYVAKVQNKTHKDIVALGAGASQGEAREAAFAKIHGADRPDDPDQMKNFSVDLNAPFTKEHFDPRTGAYFKIDKLVNTPVLVMASKQYFAAFGKEMESLGFRRARIRPSSQGATDTYGFPISRSQIKELGLTPNMRYSLHEIEPDSDGNEMFKLIPETRTTSSRDKYKMGVPGLTIAASEKNPVKESLSEGYVKPGANKEDLIIPSLGARFTFYWDHIFYKDNKFNLAIYREGKDVFKPNRDEIYLKDAAHLGIDKGYFQIFSAWLTTPRDQLEELWPLIIKALELIAANRNKDKKENTMKMDDIAEGGNPDTKRLKKAAMAALNPSPRKKPEIKTPDMRDVISGVRRGRKVAAEGIEDKDLANVHPSKFGDEGEYGMEGDYVKNQLNTMIRVMTHLKNALGDEEDLPEWVEEKVSQAKGMMVSVMDYVISEKERTIEKAKGKEVTMDEGKKKGTDGKACWPGYRFGGTENGKDKCIKVKKKKK